MTQSLITCPQCGLSQASVWAICECGYDFAEDDGDVGADIYAKADLSKVKKHNRQHKHERKHTTSGIKYQRSEWDHSGQNFEDFSEKQHRKKRKDTQQPKWF